MGNSKAKPEQSDSKEQPPNQTESIYPQLQIRNCIRNVRNNNGNFSDMYNNEAGTSCGSYEIAIVFHLFLVFKLWLKLIWFFFHVKFLCAGQVNRPSVYTIDVHGSSPSNFTNAGFVSTEGATKTGQHNDGLPTYEEAIGGVKNPNAIPITPSAPAGPPPPTVQSSVEVVNEESANGASSSGRRHRHRGRRHRGHQNADKSNDNSPSEQQPGENRRHRHRRGFRLKHHLDKIHRRNHPQTDPN